MIAEPLHPTDPRAALLPPQPPDRELPDLHRGARRRAQGQGAPARPRAARSAARAPSGPRRAARASSPAASRARPTTATATRSSRACGRPPTRSGSPPRSRWAAARLEPPGPYPEIADEPDLEEATWLAFLLALAGPGAPELHAALVAARPTWASGELPDLPGAEPRTAEAYRAWAERAGSQAEAFHGEPGWTPERRFARVFERLALPGFGRGRALRPADHARRRRPVRAAADELHLGNDDDATTLAAKRLLVSGDACCSSAARATSRSACGVRIAALDRGLAVWNEPEAPDDRGAAAASAPRWACVSTRGRALDLDDDAHAERDRRAAARVLPRRGGPDRRAHAAAAAASRRGSCARAASTSSAPSTASGSSARCPRSATARRRHPPPRRPPGRVPPRHRRRACSTRWRRASADAERWTVGDGRGQRARPRASTSGAASRRSRSSSRRRSDRDLEEALAAS